MKRRIAVGAMAFVLGAGLAWGQESRTVTIGPEVLGRWLQTDCPRQRVSEPVDDTRAAPGAGLKHEGGGLTPVRQVGQAQSVGLAMKGADGRWYTFRSLHKEPQRMMPEQLRDTWAGVIAHDQTSGTHPAAGVMLPVLAEAVGIAHTRTRLVVMPDDPALGEFRKTFANLVGTIEEFPTPVSSTYGGFMGATGDRLVREAVDAPAGGIRRSAWTARRCFGPASSTSGWRTSTAITGNGAG